MGRRVRRGHGRWLRPIELCHDPCTARRGGAAPARRDNQSAKGAASDLGSAERQKLGQPTEPIPRAAVRQICNLAPVASRAASQNVQADTDQRPADRCRKPSCSCKGRSTFDQLVRALRRAAQRCVVAPAWCLRRLCSRCARRAWSHCKTSHPSFARRSERNWKSPGETVERRRPPALARQTPVDGGGGSGDARRQHVREVGEPYGCRSPRLVTARLL